MASDFPERELSDGRLLMVLPLTFARGRLVVFPRRDFFAWDDGW